MNATSAVGGGTSGSESATISPQATPLLHHMAAAHAYINMFVTVNRTGQNDIRNISVNNWGSDLGLSVLKGLSKLYTSLVWESNILLTLCSEDALPAGCEFGKADMDKLLPNNLNPPTPSATSSATQTPGASGSACVIQSSDEQQTFSPRYEFFIGTKRSEVVTLYYASMYFRVTMFYKKSKAKKGNVIFPFLRP